ncbi:MAG: ABC transporter substrate-binding protein [bacterium]|nr:ABC transporter substrate-binding protein [bacterium]
MQNDRHPLEDFFGLKQDSSSSSGPSESDSNHSNGEEPRKHVLRRHYGWMDQLRLLPKVLSKRERYWILVFLLIIAGSIIAIPFTTYNHFTKSVANYGGSFSEGVVGQPRRINSLLAQTNDPDRDLSNLIYSGLLKYNGAGKLVPDLAKSYEISSDGLNYTIYLKDNVLWHDGQKLTADDIVYTIQTAQNADFGSPQRVNWQGVAIQKVNDTTIIFKLNNKYAQFLNNLTIGILPKHIWGTIQPINFASADYNLKPIGSGPYKFEKLQKDEVGQIQSYQLSANKDFYDGQPFINTIIIKFYDSEDSMITAYNGNDIQNISSISPQNLNKLKFKQRVNITELKVPRYFAVFFNQTKNPILANKNVRLALNYATDKQAIIDAIVGGKGSAIYSPMIESVLEINQDITKYTYDLDQAKTVLATDGWASTGDDGILQKGSGKNQTRLTIHITTSTLPDLVKIANILKDQWGKVGVEVVVDALATPQLQQVIKDRDYQSLLFGEILNLDPDPFSFWDSSQTQKLGLNLALYSNKTVDSILNDARQLLNPIERAQKYDDFQKIVISDVPAVFLFNPLHLYPQTTDIQGVDTTVISVPANRFANVEKWYINTKRIWQ